LQAAPEIPDRLTENLVQTADRLSTALARFKGLHILVFGATDVEATLARLMAAGVVAAAVNRVVRPVGTASAAKQVSIGFVDDQHAPCSGSPSGERHAALLEQARYRALSLVGTQKARTDIESRYA
jgi:hypothetical protein